MTKVINEFIKHIFNSNDFIPLHAPSFNGKELDYVGNAIESTFVSSVGEYVDKFELALSAFVGARATIATVNGTAALHAALHACGVSKGDLVITQPLTFVATCNAIKLAGAEPLFVDVSPISLGLCPLALSSYLEEHCILEGGRCFHKTNQLRISAVVPVHTFGHPVELEELLSICNEWGLLLIEDAAESLGSLYKGRHTGTFGECGSFSFNGNKIVTTGGGGAVVTKNIELGHRIKHQTTTAKVAHRFEYFHDEFGFNYRMPNLNAALGYAQLEALNNYIKSKRWLAEQYRLFFNSTNYRFFCEPHYAVSNYWLNAILCEDKKQRDMFLKGTNDAGIMTRPAWCLMNDLPMYKDCLKGELNNAKYFADRIVNIPSSPI